MVFFPDLKKVDFFCRRPCSGLVDIHWNPWYSRISMKSMDFMKSDGSIITIRLVQTIRYLIPPRETAFQKCFEKFITYFPVKSWFCWWFPAIEMGRCRLDRQNPWLSRILVIFSDLVTSTELDGTDPHTKPWDIPKFFDKPFETLPKSSYPRWNELSDGLD